MHAALATSMMLMGPLATAGTNALPPIPVDNTLVRNYQCQDGKSLQVAYYNQHEGQSFARLTVKGKAMLFVDTIAASGVKYVAGPYTWWTKGEQGDLYDMTAGPDAPPIFAACTVTPAK
ncbi:MliC family protein [Dyella telluris]|uniref:MliC family protein n=2 Tax=Dyella telluris TaxID=2763498 RepID=A0A7G8QAI4_9GAMM|nr:MliC family protein [Dyella telluris]